MPDWEDEEERKGRAAAAMSERRDVWIATMTGAVGAGRHVQEGVMFADVALDAFDEKFPGLAKVIRDWQGDHGEPEPQVEDDE